MSVWVWVVFLVLATGVAFLAVRVSRHAREDPFADIPRDDGASMLASRAPSTPASVVAPQNGDARAP